MPVSNGILAWWIAGPAIGLCVVALYALANRHLGVSGAYGQLVRLLSRSRPDEPWRLWFLGGLLGGAAVAGVVLGFPQRGTAFGVLGSRVPLGVLVPLLVLGGVAMGFGARWAGGCTSGNGLTGCSTRSVGGMGATMMFMVAAVVATAAMRLLVSL